MFSWFQSLDESIQFFVQNHLHQPLLDGIMVVFSSLGNSGVFWIALGILLLFFKKTRRCGFLVLLSLLVEFSIGEGLLKHLIARPRPYVLYPEFPLYMTPLTSTSFPSGHAMSSFAVATTLVQFDRRYGIAAYVLAVLIAISRVYLFMHWPSDVLFGALFGTLVSLAVVAAYRFFLKKKNLSL